MIDEKYRRNPENITDFLKKERFRYIKIFERLVNDKLYEEYEQCDFILEKIEEFTEEDERYLVYRIKEEENKYNVEYLKERILENFIFDELYFLVNQKFELLEILNIDEIMEKIETVQQEVIKIENVNLKLKYPDLEKYKKLVSDEDVFLEFMKNYKFYSMFKSNIFDKEKTIYGIGSKPVPLSLQATTEKGVYVINKKNILGKCKEDMIILHPLPRVDEISTDLDDTKHALYFKQAKNGIPVRQAMMMKVLDKVKDTFK